MYSTADTLTRAPARQHASRSAVIFVREKMKRFNNPFEILVTESTAAAEQLAEEILDEEEPEEDPVFEPLDFKQAKQLVKKQPVDRPTPFDKAVDDLGTWLASGDAKAADLMGVVALLRLHLGKADFPESFPKSLKDVMSNFTLAGVDPPFRLTERASIDPSASRSFHAFPFFKVMHALASPARDTLRRLLTAASGGATLEDIRGATDFVIDALIGRFRTNSYAIPSPVPSYMCPERLIVQLVIRNHLDIYTDVLTTRLSVFLAGHLETPAKSVEFLNSAFFPAVMNTILWLVYQPIAFLGYLSVTCDTHSRDEPDPLASPRPALAELTGSRRDVAEQRRRLSEEAARKLKARLAVLAVYMERVGGILTPLLEAFAGLATASGAAPGAGAHRANRRTIINMGYATYNLLCFVFNVSFILEKRRLADIVPPVAGLTAHVYLCISLCAPALAAMGGSAEAAFIASHIASVQALLERILVGRVTISVTIVQQLRDTARGCFAIIDRVTNLGDAFAPAMDADMNVLCKFAVACLSMYYENAKVNNKRATRADQAALYAVFTGESLTREGGFIMLLNELVPESRRYVLYPYAPAAVVKRVGKGIVIDDSARARARAGAPPASRFDGLLGGRVNEARLVMLVVGLLCALSLLAALLDSRASTPVLARAFRFTRKALARCSLDVAVAFVAAKMRR